MAWSSPKTWADTRDRLNAANLNQYVRDNQLALREENAALRQRVAALEAGGFSARQVVTVSFSSSARRYDTTIVPPADILFMEFDLRIGGYWTDIRQLDYAEWSALPEIAAGDSYSGDRAWRFVTSSIPSVQNPMSGRVGRGVGGVVFFVADGTLYDRVGIRWYR